MQELFTKILKLIPAFFGNLIGLLTSSKSFLVTQARRSEEGLPDGLAFLGVATVLSTHWFAPIIGSASDNLIKTAVILCVVGVVVLSLYVAVVVIAWRLVAGTASPSEHTLMFVYQAAPIVLLVPIVMLLLWPNNLEFMSPQEVLVLLGDRLARPGNPVDDLDLYFENQALSDLWIAVTWGNAEV